MCVCVSCSVVPDSLWPQGLQPIRLLCPWDFPGKDTGVDFPGKDSSPGDLPDPGIIPGSPALQADSLPSELWGKPTDMRAEAKKLTGKKSNPTHQQINGLKLHRVRPCSPEQDLVFPTTSLSHQEAYRLASSIRGQEEGRRTTIQQWLKPKPYHRKLISMKKAESYVPDERTR